MLSKQEEEILQLIEENQTDTVIDELETWDVLAVSNEFFTHLVVKTLLRRINFDLRQSLMAFIAITDRKLANLLLQSDVTLNHTPFIRVLYTMKYHPRCVQEIWKESEPYKKYKARDGMLLDDKLTDADWEILDEQPKVRELVFNGCNFKTFPVKLLNQYKELTELKIYNDTLKEIPKEINKLTKLKSVAFYGNELKDLPEEFGELINIEELNLGKNKFSSLPECLTRLNRLRKFYINECDLQEIPEIIGQLNSIAILEARNNNLEIISAKISELKHLFQLDLSFNQIKELPKEICQLENLDTLTLNNNKLSTFPNLINLTKLNTLWLNKNLIEYIPDSIVTNTNIDFINLEVNKINQIPEFILNLKKLNNLNLGSNPIPQEEKEKWKVLTDKMKLKIFF